MVFIFSGIIHTPSHVFQDFKKKNTPTYSGNNKDSSSPQWLKGNYQSPNSYSSHQQQHSQPRRNQQQKRLEWISKLFENLESINQSMFLVDVLKTTVF